MRSSRLGAALAVVGAFAVFALASGDESVAGCSFNEKQKDEQPLWSPTGDQIHFVRVLRGCFAPTSYMWVAVTGGAAQSMGSFGEIGVLSPDGTKVAFASSGIRLIDPRDGTVRRLTNGADYDPVWSPDGSRLAFVRSLPGNLQKDVFLVRADGSNAVNLTNEAGPEERPRFSPDGNWVSAIVPGGIELIRADGSGRGFVRLGTDGVSWSPDSRALAVLSGSWTSRDLYLVRVDGSVTRLTRTPANESLPVWAPDGTLAVVSGDASGHPLLLHFTAAGTPISWSNEIRPYGDYHWSPDGHALAWIGPGHSLVVAAADGSGAHTAAGFTVESTLSWAPDSRHIAVSARRLPCETRPEIAIVDVENLGLTPLTNICEILGTDGPDALTGTYDDDVIRGLGGDDRISAQDGLDLVEGGPGNDWIDGGSYPDEVDGGPGDDVVIGGGGIDELTGGPGNDTLVGGWAKDLVHARDGERDTVRCGDQIDMVYADVVDEVARDCDVVLRTTDDDYIRGTYGADTINAGPGNDYVLAGAGNDRIDGGAGDDFLVGDWGDDRVIGGPGRDRLVGGPGADVLNARDGQGDVVDCGAREDTALVDRYDVVLWNCEHVKRTT